MKRPSWAYCSCRDDARCQNLLSGCSRNVSTLVNSLQRIRGCLGRIFARPLVPQWTDVSCADILLHIPTVWIVYETLRICWNGGAFTVIASGGLATIAMWWAFGTAHKSYSLLSLFGLSWERLVDVHYWAGLATLVLGVYHGYLAYARWGLPLTVHFAVENATDDHSLFDVVNTSFNATTNTTRTTLVPSMGTDFGRQGSSPNAWYFLWDGWVNRSGTLLTLAFVLLVGSSLLPGLRRKFYTAWYALHIVASLAVLYFGYVHFRASFPIMITWGIDILVRNLLQSCLRYPRRAQVERILDGVVCLTWPKTQAFDYQPGQFVRLAIPSISPQFHPFSLASAPHESHVRVYVRALGPWSRKVNQLGVISERSDDEESCGMGAKASTIPILLEGAYGCPSFSLRQAPYVVLIAGGVGLAPCQSIALSRLHGNKRNLQKLRLVWAVREMDLVDAMLAPELYDNKEEVEDTNASMPTETDGLLSNGSHRLMQTDIFHTQGAPSEPKVLNATTTLYSGQRPDMKGILDSVVRDVVIGSNHRHVVVPVVCCGPTALVNAAKQACRKYMSCCGGHQVEFEMHAEISEF